MLRTAFLLLAIHATPHLFAQDVARIGAGSITRQQLEQRIAIERAYGGTMSQEAALVSIMNDQFERGVAASLGLLLDSSELRRFSEHADQTSKAPHTLAAVKRIFGIDTSEYRLLYLAPRLINMKLHAFFNLDSAQHADAGSGGFDSWFRRRAASIEIRIEDASLHRDVTRRYHHLWWVSRVVGTGAALGTP